MPHSSTQWPDLSEQETRDRGSIASRMGAVRDPQQPSLTCADCGAAISRRPVRDDLIVCSRLGMRGARVRRREFIALVLGAVTSSHVARAQQRPHWRIGFLETVSPALNAANFDAFKIGLRELG